MGHGFCFEERRQSVTGHVDWIDRKERVKWLGLRSVPCLESVRHLPGEELVMARRYWLSTAVA